MAESKTQELTQRPKTIMDLLGDPKVKYRFQEILDKEAPAFISSIISAYRANPALAEVDQNSIIQAAAIGAAVKLPFTPGLGFACLVPYNGVAQFQIMARGFIQLGLRSGQYSKIAFPQPLYEGQLVSWNPITEDIVIDLAAKKSDKVTGWVFYYKLVNGFEKYTYMMIAELEAHGKKYSKSYSNPKGKWQTDKEIMYAKTVVKKGMRVGPMSTEIQTALQFDQATVKENGESDYIDGETVPEPKPEYEMPKAIIEEAQDPVNDAQEPEQASAPATSVGKLITEPQRKRFYAIWKNAGKTEDQVKDMLFSVIGSQSSKDIPMDKYESLVKWAESK